MYAICPMILALTFVCDLFGFLSLDVVYGLGYGGSRIGFLVLLWCVLGYL